MGRAFQHDDEIDFHWKVTYLDKIGYKHVRYFVTVKGAYEFAMDCNGDIEKLPEYDRETYIEKE